MAIKYSMPLLSFILLLAFSSAAGLNYCIYNVFIQTGLMDKPGTDSTIHLAVHDRFNEFISISDIVEWGGIMGPGYDYFERGSLDFFSGRLPCSSICGLNLTSDGTGPYPEWYVNYVEIKVNQADEQYGCWQQRFDVEQWLDSSNLTVIRNNCASSTQKDHVSVISAASI